jgi:hypothetical protein
VIAVPPVAVEKVAVERVPAGNNDGRWDEERGGVRNAPDAFVTDKNEATEVQRDLRV